MSDPDAQPPPAAWWNPSTANTSTTPTIVRWFDAAGREIPAPKDGYTDEQFRRASAAVARCFALDAEVAPTRSREFYNEIAHSVLAAALAGTTTPTDEPTEIEYGVVWPDGSERVYGGDCTGRLCAEQHGKYATDADARAVRREVRTVYGPWQPLASIPTAEEPTS